MQSNVRVSVVRFATMAMTAAAIALMAACGGDSTGPKTANLTGVYNLTTVNGASLPYTVPHTGVNVGVVQDAVITLGADSTYLVTGDGTLNGSERALFTDGGVYSVSGSQVTFTSIVVEGEQYTANVTGATSHTITATIAGALVGSSDLAFVLRFEKTP
jgi:hypothetical protein